MYLAALLQLEHIKLLDFKNYADKNFAFNQRIVGIYGPNGVGKTNLLDAIHYLCFSKSYFSRSDARSVRDGFPGFRISGNFIVKEEEVQMVCILRENGRKELSWNAELYDRFSSHIGKLPCVVIAPDDAVIITSVSEERRRFLDTIIAQIDPDYLTSLIRYNRVLQQRNAYLKSLTDSFADHKLLDVYDEQLASCGEMIYKKRAEFLTGFGEAVSSFYRRIAGTHENIALQYRSQLAEESLAVQLKKGRNRDILNQRSNSGIHKDDIEFFFGSQVFKTHASQGQKKTLLFALKLAEYEVLTKAKGFEPLLLLDDVFEKLDENRIKNLLETVCLGGQGQIFITDTHPGRIEEKLARLAIEMQAIELID